MANSSRHSASRDVELQVHLEEIKRQHQCWWSCLGVLRMYYHLPDNTIWNVFICIEVLTQFFLVSLNPNHYSRTNVGYSVLYAIHVSALLYRMLRKLQYVNIEILVIASLSNENMNGSVLGTTLKYCYIFIVIRVTWAMVWVYCDIFAGDETSYQSQILNTFYLRNNNETQDENSIITSRFLCTLIILNKMFIPIGPTIPPHTDLDRIASLMVMITGCLAVTGIAVASLSLVICLYMKPEESFRSRYMLILKEMTDSHVPQSLRNKVDTFYKMYWHEQGGVSATQLLPIFPPTLNATIYAEIYFRAMQKSSILRDLPYQFLSEISKKMETIHYIPGDPIITRNTKKSSIIYITYGDIEMLTAEDDSTAILRMSRGTILSPYASCPSACVRAHVEIRAATFCTAHVLSAAELWRVASKYGHGSLILGYFYGHFGKVRNHYFWKIPENAKYKSSILHFKQKLMHIKNSKDSEGNPQLTKTDAMMEIAGSYVMRNRADATLTEESDAICLRLTFPYILQPSSSVQVVWHSFVTCVILIVCFTHPYYLVFNRQVPIKYRFFDYVVTLIFAFDLMVHLSTGSNVAAGVPITLAQTSSEQARSFWFMLDVIATLPLFEFIADGHFAGINKLLRLHKVFRMLKAMEEECVYHSSLLRFLSYTLLLLISCYLLAALQQGFTCFHFNLCYVNNITHSPYWSHEPGNTAIALEGESLAFSLFWAISMLTFTTHLEDYSGTIENLSYFLFVLELCVLLHIFMEAVYSATIMVTTAMREDYDACISNVMSFLVRNEVEAGLRDRFKSYLLLLWHTDKAYSMTDRKSSIFYDLPPHVYQDIVTRQRSKYLLCVPFMKYLHKEDLKNVSSNAKLFYTCPNEILLNTGDICNELYVIKQGMCEVLSPVTKNVIAKISARNHFGVISCLLRLPAFYTVRAVTHVQVFSISRKFLLNAIEIPQIKDAIDFAREQPEYTYLQYPFPPFVVYTAPAPIPNVERFRLPRKHEKDHDFLNPFTKLGVFNVLRYIFPRFTIRPDGPYLARYEWFRAVCALASALLFPCYCYMMPHWPFLFYIVYILDLLAIFDILQRILVSYFNVKGLLVYHPASTAAHYLKGAFIVDLVACLPLENLEQTIKESYSGQYYLPPIKQYLCLNRLLQLYRIPGALIGLTGCVRPDILLVLRATPIFLALLSVLTSFIVFNSVKMVIDERNIHNYQIIPFNDNGGSWTHLFHHEFHFNLTENSWNLHLATYFWVVYQTTSTGYNTFRPTNYYQMIILIIGMIIGAIITTYFSVRVISTRANVNKALASFQQHTTDIVRFMKRENLDSALQSQVIEHHKYSWDKMSGVNYRDVLKLCDQITLRTDIILHIYGGTFAKCPVVNQCDVALLRIIGRALRNCHFLKDTTIVTRDDVISDLYLVDKGVVEVRYNNEQGRNVRLGQGSMFGNLQCLSSVRSPVTIHCASPVHLLHMRAVAFHNIVADFPQIIELFNYYITHDKDFVLGTEEINQLDTKDPDVPRLLSYGLNIYQHIMKWAYILRAYLVIVSMSCIYMDVYNAGFQDNRPSVITALYVLDLAFCWKFLLVYFLPLSLHHDDICLQRERRRYFKSEFKCDILSILPLEGVCVFSNNINDRWMLFSLLRLNRLFRIVTVYKCAQQRHESVSVSLLLTTIKSVCIWMTLFIHINTCFWHFLGLIEEKEKPKSSWFYLKNGMPACSNEYICSLYFVVCTVTQNGIGDIIPRKQAEVIFVSVLQLISTMVYMIYVGEFSNIIQYYSFRSFRYYSKIIELKEFLKNNRVSPNLVKFVYKYAIHLWRESRGVQLPNFLIKAPNCIKLEVMSKAYLHHLNAHPIFRNCEAAFLRQLVGCFQLYTYIKGMYVVKEKEITDSQYFVHWGRVMETAEHCDSTRLYFGGENFGWVQGFTHNLPHTHTYITLIQTQVLTLCFKDWEYLLAHFPNSKQVIENSLIYDEGPDDKMDKKDRKVTIVKDEQTEDDIKIISNLKSSKLDTSLAADQSHKDELTQTFSDTDWTFDSREEHNDVHPKYQIKNFSTLENTSAKILEKFSTPEVSGDTLLLNEEEEATQALLAKIENPQFQDEAMNGEELLEDDKVNEMLTHVHSVEEYFMEPYDVPELDRELTEESSDEPTSTARMKQDVHVRYKDSLREEIFKHLPGENFELKPIRNLSTESRDFKTLDSDVDPNKKTVNEILSAVSVDSVDSDALTRQKKKKPS